MATCEVNASETKATACTIFFFFCSLSFEALICFTSRPTQPLCQYRLGAFSWANLFFGFANQLPRQTSCGSTVNGTLAKPIEERRKAKQCSNHLFNQNGNNCAHSWARVRSGSPGDTEEEPDFRRESVSFEDKPEPARYRDLLERTADAAKLAVKWQDTRDKNYPHGDISDRRSLHFSCIEKPRRESIVLCLARCEQKTSARRRNRFVMLFKSPVGESEQQTCLQIVMPQHRPPIV